MEGLTAPGGTSAPRRAAVQAIDPVCGMTVTVGPDTPHLPSTAASTGSACTGCRDRFAGGRSRVTVTGLVLAAGGSDRLGRPKQLLAYRGATLLDATLEVARRCRFDQVLVTLGGAADEVRAQVDLTGVEVVDNLDFGAGCASSIVAALERVDPASEGLVLLLGDQPGVTVEAVAAVVRVGAGSPLAVCAATTTGSATRFWFGRDRVRRAGRAARRQGRVEAARVGPPPGARGADRQAGYPSTSTPGTTTRRSSPSRTRR